VREINASELRRIVSAGGAVSLKRAIDAVSAARGGEPIEARAFDLGGVFYRIVLKRPNGALVSVIIDAETGREVSKSSSIGEQITTAAGTGAKAAKGKSQAAGAKASGESKGNSGNSGNGGGKGNAGGNGNGNGGGKDKN
jgi:hypothetical protein